MLSCVNLVRKSPIYGPAVAALYWVGFLVGPETLGVSFLLMLVRRCIIVHGRPRAIVAFVVVKKMMMMCQVWHVPRLRRIGIHVRRRRIGVVDGPHGCLWPHFFAPASCRGRFSGGRHFHRIVLLPLRKAWRGTVGLVRNIALLWRRWWWMWLLLLLQLKEILLL